MLPEGDRLQLLGRELAGRHHPGLVPVNLATELGAGPAVHLGTGAQAHCLGRHLETHPLPEFRKVAHAQVGSIVAPGPVPLVRSPVSAVFPTPVIELQLHGLGWVFRVEVDVNEELVAGRNLQRLLGAREVVLAQALCNPHRRGFAAEHRVPLGLSPALPRVGSLVAFHLGALRQGVIEPVPVGRGQRPQFFAGPLVLVTHLAKHGLERGLCFRHLLRQFPFPLSLLPGGHFDRWRRQQLVPVHRILGETEEIREELVEFLLGERVELVIVTSSAPGGEAEPHRRGGLDPLHRVAHVVFLVDRSPFSGGHVASVEPGGDPLTQGRLREEIPGQLLDRELVEGLVGVERVDHPVAIRPDPTLVVEVQAVGVPVARGVQPEPGHVFAVALRGQKTVDHLLVGIGT